MKGISINDLMYHHTNKDGSPRFLYHYTKFDSFLKIINSETIKLNSLSRMNDPYEFIDRDGPMIYNGGSDDQLFDMYGKFKQAHSERSNTIRLVSFSMDTKYHNGWDLYNMWNFYGDGHTGICLILDYQELTNTFTDYCRENKMYSAHQKIHYTKDIDQYEDMFTHPNETFIDETHIQHLFIKPDYFSHEQEYRLLVSNPSLNNPDIPVYIPIKSSLRVIITGRKFPFNEKPFSHHVTDEMVSSINNCGYQLEWFYHKNHIDSCDVLGCYKDDKILMARINHD